MTPAWTLAMGAARYAPWLDCGAVQVLAAERSDSALRDLAQWVTTRGYAQTSARTAVALVVRQPARPVTAKDVWPTPAGNLYVAFDLDARPDAAAKACADAVLAVTRILAPKLAVHAEVSPGDARSAWAELTAGGRTVGGVAVLARGARSQCGIDVHLAATDADYGPHARTHASLRTLTGSASPPEAVLAILADALAPRLHPAP